MTSQCEILYLFIFFQCEILESAEYLTLGRTFSQEFNILVKTWVVLTHISKNPGTISSTFAVTLVNSVNNIPI